MVHFRGLCLQQKVQSTTNAHFVHVFVFEVTITKKYERFVRIFLLWCTFRGLCLRQKVQSTTNVHFVHVLVYEVTITKKYEP